MLPLQRKYMNTSFMSLSSKVPLWTLKYDLEYYIIFDISGKVDEAGEIPVAFVVKKVGSVLSSKHVIDYVAKQVFLYKRDMKFYDI